MRFNHTFKIERLAKARKTKSGQYRALMVVRTIFSSGFKEDTTHLLDKRTYASKEEALKAATAKINRINGT